MKCPFCEALLQNEDQNFCQVCGANLSSISDSETNSSNAQSSFQGESTTNYSISGQNIDPSPEDEELIPNVYQSQAQTYRINQLVNKGRSSAKKSCLYGFISALVSIIGLISGGILMFAIMSNNSYYSTNGQYLIDPDIGPFFFIIPIMINVMSIIFGVVSSIYKRRAKKIGYYGKSYRRAGFFLTFFGIYTSSIGIVVGGFTLISFLCNI